MFSASLRSHSSIDTTDMDLSGGKETKRKVDVSKQLAGQYTLAFPKTPDYQNFMADGGRLAEASKQFGQTHLDLLRRRQTVIDSKSGISLLFKSHIITSGHATYPVKQFDASRLDYILYKCEWLFPSKLFDVVVDEQFIKHHSGVSRKRNMRLTVFTVTSKDRNVRFTVQSSWYVSVTTKSLSCQEHGLISESIMSLLTRYFGRPPHDNSFRQYYDASEAKDKPSNPAIVPPIAQDLKSFDDVKRLPGLRFQFKVTFRNPKTKTYDPMELSSKLVKISVKKTRKAIVAEEDYQEENKDSSATKSRLDRKWTLVLETARAHALPFETNDFKVLSRVDRPNGLIIGISGAPTISNGVFSNDAAETKLQTAFAKVVEFAAKCYQDS